MNTTIQIITGVIETGIIAYIVYIIIKGLRIEIKTLQSHVNTQNETIKTMDKRIQETEKIGDLYKKLVSDFPQALEDYQAVITKTKDKTIYELNSKLEEYELTIEDLIKRTKKASPELAKKASGISKLFLNKDNKDLLEFLQKIGKPEDIIDAMLKSNDFNNLMTNLGQEIEMLEQNDPRELFGSEFMLKYNAKTATFGLGNGFYMITFDNKIYITPDWLEKFKLKYSELK